MLILSRKLDESIIINGEIELKIISIDENRVRLGIVAPQNYEIHRKEVYEKIQEENRSAADSAKSVEALKSFRMTAEKKPD